MLLLILITLVVVCCVYLKIIVPQRYWKDKGIIHETPYFLFGSFYKTVLRQVSIADILKELYLKFRNERYFGCYQFTNRALIINDLDLIKKIAIKDFDTFPNHFAFSREDIDPLWCKHLLASQGDNWKKLRTTLSPLFTSNKIKLMFNFVVECAEQVTNHFIKEDISTVEMRDVFTRFTNDAIASCAFGIKCDSLKEKENQFYINGLKATYFGGFRALMIFMYQICPPVAKFFGIKVFSTSLANFFRKLVEDSIKMRGKEGIVRPDLIHLLMEVQKNGSKLKITNEDITAQSLLFYLAGFETSSTAMAFASYELVVNKDIQDRLRKEILKTLKSCNGKLTYEALMEMKYMDMFVSETLRKWPPAFATDRVCTENYVIEPERPNEKPLVLHKGLIVLFPIFGIHRDPVYYPDPEKFDPERFSEQNKHNIVPFSFIPFGVGPRYCLGSRLALLEIKIIIFYMLSKFEIVPVERTKIPVELDKSHFSLQIDGGMWLGLKKLKA